MVKELPDRLQPNRLLLVNFLWDSKAVLLEAGMSESSFSMLVVATSGENLEESMRFEASIAVSRLVRALGGKTLGPGEEFILEDLFNAYRAARPDAEVAREYVFELRAMGARAFDASGDKNIRKMLLLKEEGFLNANGLLLKEFSKGNRHRRKAQTATLRIVSGVIDVRRQGAPFGSGTKKRSG